MKQFYLLVFASISIASAQIQPTTAQKVEESLIAKQAMDANSLVKNIPLKNIGPSVMSGRVVDLAVNEDNPTEYYVAYASGGLWYTNNNGTTFTPVIDETQTQNIGDIAVHWKSGTIWVGTGENNASRSSYAGIGILKSTDNGKTWQNMGLIDSHHIGRIVLNPNNANEVTVGVAGHLYSPNSERGIYKTTDGGKTWKNTLFINDNTGIIDVAVSPNNFNIQYAAAWQKDRKAWDFIGNGSGSGIYKSSDAGATWSKISTPTSGFPTGEGVGRIGLAVFDDNIIYAVHDNQFRRNKEKEKEEKQEGLTKDDFKSLSKEEFLNLNDKELNDFLKTNNFQEKYRAANVKQMVRSNAVKPVDLALYLEDANSLLFDTPVIGAEVYRSTDGGTKWVKQNSNYIDDLFYSYGYYFAQISIDPKNSEAIYVSGVPIISSKDGGKTYKSINGDNVHSDHHAVWVNPNLPGHLINGNDGGVNTSYDDGASWVKNNSPNVGQFYAIAVDNEKPYNVYGGLQDNGVWMGPHNAEASTEWHQTGQYPWKSILGGDGMQVQVDARNANIVYTGFQFGNYFRLDLENDKRTYIQPKHELGETPYRFNWQTPILLSSHNQDILYMGGNKLHRSLDQGDTWETISGDLTQGGKKGNVAFGTLATITESPFKFGLLYTGSDDGLIHRTDNGGGNWENISKNLPQNLWVSRVVASKHNKNRVYATLNGYRSDDFTSYIYVSENKGNTWKSISNNIPASPVNVIIEDSENENLLFVGTDNGLYASLDKGDSWESFKNGIPAVAIHDLVIQKEAKHLLVGTHGRSIYKAEIASLQNLTSEILKKELHIYPLENIKHSIRWGNSWSSWSKASTPGLDITFYSNRDDVYQAKIKSSDDIIVSETEITANMGLNILSYDLAFTKIGKLNYLKKHKTELKQSDNGSTYLPKGTYLVEITGNGTSENVTFEIE
ncbi:VPS10 domain-containing protein [Maribacter hydrothermalis]|uniref:Glycosyl hydrolase n=1 Tax=Maribacter hydrothermalis TaxID=1836467 RepID=A0A1B7ZEQ0_9FLAO|nr:glycosyl hydrolase [Maribacter hydrothermalis]APQ17433.1 glycosyl hydrolase [Maribacter hydrothermalis]OBR41912.1 glycosyl hydrolase [Maribacter hydrothermalis]